MTPRIRPVRKIGYACITLDEGGAGTKEMQFKTATVAHQQKMTEKERKVYLSGKVADNLRALYAVVGSLKIKPPSFRMFRIPSGILPLYTHEISDGVYKDPGFIKEMQRLLGVIGTEARENNVRLSFHPAQYCVLNSNSPRVVENAMAEMEYHATVGEWLGYKGRGVDDFVINIHGGTGAEVTMKGRIASWDRANKGLSKRARGLISVENDEYSWNATQVLKLCEHYGYRMVLDVHHQWISNGYWTEPGCKGEQRIKDTWAGLVPKLHLSLPQPSAFPKGRGNDIPLTGGGKDGPMPKMWSGVGSKMRLRQHADYIWHPAAPSYALRWSDAGFDIMVEAKMKSLAQQNLLANMAMAEFWKGT